MHYISQSHTHTHLQICPLKTCTHKLWYLNVMESLTNFNIVFVCIISLYTLGNVKNQAVVINMSVGLIIIQIFAILLYHVFIKCTNLFSRLQNVELHRKFAKPKEKEQNANELELEAPPSPVESIYCDLENFYNI